LATIFLVDDEEHLHQIYRALFAIKGHTIVASAFDGIEAVEKFRSLNPRPNVVVMDHRMPRMDGLTATKKLVEMDPKCRIIFVSADATVQDEALKAGAKAFQVKPVRAAELFAVIEKLMQASS
jgi:two-component system chemotaxis response regulator CheY